MSNNLELLHEGFQNEVNDLQSMLEHADTIVLKTKKAAFTRDLKNVISNLEGLCDSLYSEFENSVEGEYEELKTKYDILLSILSDRLDYEDKTYIRLKHGIDLT